MLLFIPLKMYPVFLFPHSEIASLLMESTVFVCVFWERRRMPNPSSESCSISSHFGLWCDVSDKLQRRRVVDTPTDSIGNIQQCIHQTLIVISGSHQGRFVLTLGILNSQCFRNSSTSWFSVFKRVAAKLALSAIPSVTITRSRTSVPDVIVSKGIRLALNASVYSYKRCIVTGSS